MKCRVYYKPDGSVSILQLDPKYRALNRKVTETKLLNRQHKKIKPELKALPHEDIELDALPKKDRDKWRGSKGKGVHVDKKVVTVAEKRQAIEDALDAELAKSNPDAVAVLRLQRQLDKKDY